ncbi:actin-related protein 2/3 complex subunit 1 [Dacryopinax primogenitus]|uniref:Actin-related protein 2/3 complex subunit n=1 Tax=Dacryopinax primogenitus (strain DJM 731) TaxID=1858805 RepID=M5GBU2_DACPD|nr:actin-related protein 2/3 complex subunit 1 [Dacryopinax primogenitus]EJU03537.1 actin-related protein 2/3 complex subunit 1 [Dacryopinax primogenitus]
MSAPQVFSLSQGPITSHAFNADRSQVCVSLNSNEAQVMSYDGKAWNTTETLTEHDKLITSIDWAPHSNRIVTCSQDRNAYVWTQVQDAQTGELIWKPTLVLLRINRAATFVKWSPNEDKFAVASGARAIAVCSFDEENNWWVSRHLKKPIRSTVLSIDWHPNNVLLAAGSADMKARVFSAFIKDVDKRPGPSVWGDKLPFNTICGEYASPNGGWVHNVAFSPSGDAMAFVSHDSSISVVYPGGAGMITIKTTILPYVALTWTSEESIVTAGHDCQPHVFHGSQAGWSMVGSLDSSKGAQRQAGSRNQIEAFNRFRAADTRGSQSEEDTELLPTVHQNTITSVRTFDATRVSTSGVDGRLVIWDANAVGQPVGNLVGKMVGMRV